MACRRRRVWIDLRKPIQLFIDRPIRLSKTSFRTACSDFVQYAGIRNSQADWIDLPDSYVTSSSLVPSWISRFDQIIPVNTGRFGIRNWRILHRWRGWNRLGFGSVRDWVGVWIVGVVGIGSRVGSEIRELVSGLGRSNHVVLSKSLACFFPMLLVRGFGLGRITRVSASSRRQNQFRNGLQKITNS